MAIARNDMTPPPIFRAALAELGRILVYEAGRDWLPTMQQQINSPVGVADATFVDPTQPVKVSHCTRSKFHAKAKPFDRARCAGVDPTGCLHATPCC